jgi:hypothetical protein
MKTAGPRPHLAGKWTPTGVCNVAGCKRLTLSGYRMCEQCRAYRRERTQARIAAIRVSGLCLWCPNPVKGVQTGARLCDDCQIRRRERKREIKRLVLEQYGGVRCAKCGVTHLAVLSLDHVDGDGAAHRRREFGRQDAGGTIFYRRLLNQGCPKEPRLQVLCMNCHFLKDQGSDW